MARPATNHESKKAEIIAAATRSFLQHGYGRTSNGTIAKEGGFSPALIYHYFPGGKLELFQTCVHSFQPFNQFIQQFQLDQAAPPEIYLRQLALGYLQMIQDEDVVNMIRVIISETPRFPEISQWIPQMVGPVMLRPFASYLGQHLPKEQWERQPSLALVMTFLGPLFLRMFFKQMNVEQLIPLPLPTNEELAETVVQTFLAGLRQPQPERG